VVDLDWDTIGSRLQDLRLALGLTQKALARRLGDYEGALISKYEGGYVHASIEQLARICEITGESLDWIVLGRAEARKIQELPKATTKARRRPAASVSLIRKRDAPSAP
jgi:transcriptional regulator with XRE-family HTH domain